MVRKFAALFLALVLTASAAAAPAPEDAAVQISFVEFVELGAEGKKELGFGGGYGSGVCVWSAGGKSLIVTNRHVCPYADGFCFVRHKGRSYAAERVGIDDRADLCLLRVNLTLPVIKLAAAEPNEGDTLQGWGFAEAKIEKEKYAGRALKLDKIDQDGYRFLPVGWVPVPGCSGGPVVNCAGELVGLVYIRVGNPPSYGGAVRLADLRRFLSLHIKGI